MNRAVTPPPVPPSSRPGGAGKAGPAKGSGKLGSRARITAVKTQGRTLVGKVDAENFASSGATIGLRSLSKKRHKEKTAAREAAAKKPEEEEKIIKEVTSVQDEAEGMAKRNREFKPPALVTLFKSLRPTDTPEDILRKVQNLYRDPYLADEVLAFLERVTPDNTELKLKVQTARDLLNGRHEREIKAGHNTRGPVEAFGKKHPKVKQAPNALRDLYYAITGQEHTATDLFNHFFSKFPFDHQVFIYGFLFDALGADLKAKGSSIPKPQLIKLVKDVKKIQAVFSVFRYFKSSERALRAEFKRYHIPYPQAGNFEQK